MSILRGKKDCSMNYGNLLLIDNNEDIRWLVGTFIKEKWPVNVIALESIDDGLKALEGGLLPSLVIVSQEASNSKVFDFIKVLSTTLSWAQIPVILRSDLLNRSSYAIMEHQLISVIPRCCGLAELQKAVARLLNN